MHSSKYRYRDQWLMEMSMHGLREADGVDQCGEVNILERLEMVASRTASSATI
jgi:hypothetical protein